MHTYNNMLFREHQSVFKETFLLLTLTQFSSPEILTVTSSLCIFSETVYACVCVCVCVCVCTCTQIATYFCSLCLVQGHSVEGALDLKSSPGVSCQSVCSVSLLSTFKRRVLAVAQWGWVSLQHQDTGSIPGQAQWVIGPSIAAVTA